MPDVNLCVRLGSVCLFAGDSLPAQTLSFEDEAGDPVTITSASVDMTLTKLDGTAELTYTEADTDEVDRTAGTITYQVGAADMATLTVGTYTLAIVVALGTTWTRTAIQRVDIQKKRV